MVQERETGKWQEKGKDSGFWKAHKCNRRKKAKMVQVVIGRRSDAWYGRKGGSGGSLGLEPLWAVNSVVRWFFFDTRSIDISLRVLFLSLCPRLPAVSIP